MAYEDYVAALGDVVEPSLANIQLPRMRGILSAIRRQPSFKPVRLFVQDAGLRLETLEVEVEADVPQDRKYNILPRETLLIQCCSVETYYPTVLAMRPDFPETPHQGGRYAGQPRPLCLYAEPFEEQELVWNPTNFLIRVTDWLAKTAVGTLHPDDQPVEPFFFTTRRFAIVPLDLPFNGQRPADKAVIGFSIPPTPDAPDGDCTVVLETVPVNEAAALRRTYGRRAISILAIETEPTEHGIVHGVPRTFGEFNEILKSLGVDLLGQTRAYIRAHRDSAAWDPADGFLVLVRIPLTRNGKVEAHSTAAFVLSETIKEVGLAVDALLKDENGRIFAHHTMSGVQLKNEADQFKLEYTSAVEDVDTAAAAMYSGTADTFIGANLVIAGTGVLGSDVFSHLVRSGFSKITALDQDIVLPHNLVRHRATRQFVGANKTVALAAQHHKLWPDVELNYIARGVSAAFRVQQLRNAVEASDVILDCTASPAASRTLSIDFGGTARRISCFATPTVNDCVMLAEDASRTLRLDSVEAQYYRFLLSDKIGETHLDLPKKKYRYGLGCRDRSTVMAPETMAIHAGLLTEEIKKTLLQSEARALVWHRTEDSITRTTIPLTKECRKQCGDLTVIWDEEVERKMAVIRAKGLPGETGGPLVGYFDAKRQMVYIVDALPPPPDSKTGRGHFIRGTDGLSAELKRLSDRSGGVVVMIGDWHSHPLGVAPIPSGDDIRLLLSQGITMAQDDRPGLIGIVGDDGRPNFYIGIVKDLEI